ncbi:TetR/AcrR family transcriptional regulator [Wukongibacter sp. M2B1]|uniref:TetR/AcrR family transcriptional regulator n=1 Tax=Wukongibacter sp. M2B1 TaxID=3088895 RepID=UPI003D7905A4
MSTKKNSKEKILICAKKEFLEKGYKDASLRNIVKTAGVTTGAFYAHFSNKHQLFEILVKPALEEFNNMHENMSRQYYELLDTKRINNESLWSISDYNMKRHIDYIYSYLDEFKLIFVYSEGTKYANLIEQVVNCSVEEGLRYFEYLKKQGIKVNRISREELHILSHIHFSAIYEVVKHDMSKSEAYKYLDTITKFFVAGWNSVLGIEVNE